jgi:transposase
VQSFREQLLQKSPEKLDDLLIQTEHCDLKKLQNFAAGRRQEYEAVKAVLSHKWSSGQVEGQVNRLKAIKHQMHSRANFDLVRNKILGPPK